MFNVELSVVGYGGHSVAALYGELDLADAAAVAAQLMAAAADRGSSIIVDLAGLDFIDCCGMGVLVRVLEWTRSNGGDMSLAAPQQHVLKILNATGLIGGFSIYPSVQQAVTAATLAKPLSAVAL